MGRVVGGVVGVVGGAVVEVVVGREVGVVGEVVGVVVGAAVDVVASVVGVVVDVVASVVGGVVGAVVGGATGEVVDRESGGATDGRGRSPSVAADAVVVGSDVSDDEVVDGMIVEAEVEVGVATDVVVLSGSASASSSAGSVVVGSDDVVVEGRWRSPATVLSAVGNESSGGSVDSTASASRRASVLCCGSSEPAGWGNSEVVDVESVSRRFDDELGISTVAVTATTTATRAEPMAQTPRALAGAVRLVAFLST